MTAAPSYTPPTVLSLWHGHIPAARPPGNAMIRIVREVAERHGLRPHDLTGPHRWKSYVAARFEAIWLIYQERWPDGRRVYSLPQIGRHFNRDHTSVLNAIRRYEGRNPWVVASITVERIEKAG